MNGGYFISKKNGSETYISDGTIKLIGAAEILRNFYEKDGHIVELPSIEIPEEIKKLADKLSIAKLRDAVTEMSDEELKEYLDDDRSTARTIAETELKRREDADSE